jgi:mono/diheme cytochrome c family protein
VPIRIYLVGVLLAILVVAGGRAWDAGWFEPPRPPLVETPEAVAAGRAVFAYRCMGCHRDVSLEKRVAGWSADRAYETIGRLPRVPRANMPQFQGTEQDRRALAVYLQAFGAGRARLP